MERAVVEANGVSKILKFWPLLSTFVVVCAWVMFLSYKVSVYCDEMVQNRKEHREYDVILTKTTLILETLDKSMIELKANQLEIMKRLKP